MGVPAFFWWLIKKYPSVLIDCKDKKQLDQETSENIYVDASIKNPNVVEYDNLYVDLNGIINPCIRPKNKPPPKNEEDMISAIYDCLDRLFGIARPRKLLYLAIDGVAPKAKIHLQRSQRFKTAKEAIKKNPGAHRMREERGCRISSEQDEETEGFDLNCITPGTQFMDRLIKCLHFYIHDRLNNNGAWNEIKVIFSDANVPGEGRHKIMDFIRKQRFQPDHDPNTQHIVCGANADLIMLGLATHDPNITIIREEFLLSKPTDLCDLCNQFDHDMKNCIGLTDPQTSFGSKFTPDDSEVKFVLLRLSYLRAYLRTTLEMYNLQFQYNFERALDDWILLSFLVDNDFLPPLLCLEIREGAIDRLVDLYKKCVYKTGGYLTDSGEIVLERLELILADLGFSENHIFKNRYEHEIKMQQLKPRKEEEMNMDKASNALRGPQTFTYRSGVFSQRNLGLGLNQRPISDGADNDVDIDIDEEKDEVRLWDLGFKDRYYQTKFESDPDDLCFRYTVALQYIRGLSWILKYCYQGCPSWTWYFPYHHAPFASDFGILQGLSTDFEKGSKPMSPLEQLMSILPAESSYLVPRSWAPLMCDPNSPIIDMYPKDFSIDIERKNDACLVVALLPFVDESRLIKILQPYYKQRNYDIDLRRYKHGENRLYLNKSHPKSNLLIYLDKMLDYNKEVSLLLDGMLGSILKSKENIPLHEFMGRAFPEAPNIINNETITVRFRDPKYPEDFKFPSVRLAKAVDPPSLVLLEARKNKYYTAVNGFKSIWSQQAYSTPGGPRMFCYHKNGQQKYSPRPPLSVLNFYNNYTQGNLSHHHQQNQHQQQVISTGCRVFVTNPPNLVILQHPQKQQLQYGNAYWSGPGFKNKTKNLSRSHNNINPNKRDGTTGDIRYQKCGGRYQIENDPNQQQQKQQQQQVVNPIPNGGQQQGGYLNNHSQGKPKSSSHCMKASNPNLHKFDKI